MTDYKPKPWKPRPCGDQVVSSPEDFNYAELVEALGMALHVIDQTVVLKDWAYSLQSQYAEEARAVHKKVKS